MNNKKEYEALKEDFNTFIYKISHDLNAPLRHIKEFTKILLSSITNPTNEQRQISNLVLKSVEQSENMIEAILKYSRISVQDKNLIHFNTKDLLVYVIDNLEIIIKEKNARIVLPSKNFELLIDYKQIGDALIHIVENALKFCKNNTPPHIIIDINKNNNSIIFSIKDNGIGIAERYFKEIFYIFKKLNPEKPGAGIGLALSKKIIENHNGKVWLESELNKYTIFYVAIPYLNLNKINL